MSDPSMHTGDSQPILIDGTKHYFPTDEDTPILHLLRRHTRKLAAKQGCEVGECGTCTLLCLSRTAETPRFVQAVPACQLNVSTLRNQHLVTYDGLEPEPRDWLEAIIDHEFATPCGYCRPGLVIRLTSILLRVTDGQTDLFTEERMAAELWPHLCRCSGYGAWQRVVARLSESLTQKNGPPGPWFPDSWWPEDISNRWPDSTADVGDDAAHWVADTTCLADLHQAEDQIYGWTTLLAAWQEWIPNPLHTTASLPTLWRHPVLGRAIRISALACGIAPHPGPPPWQWRFPKLDRPIQFAWERAYLANHLGDDLVLALHTRRKGARLTRVGLAVGGFGLPEMPLPAVVAPLEATHLNPDRRETVIEALVTTIENRQTDFFNGNQQGVLRFAVHRLFDQIDDSSTPWPTF